MKSASAKRYEGKFSRLLEPDEKIITVGQFQTRPSVKVRILTAGFANIANKNFLIGITDKAKMIVIPNLDYMGMEELINEAYKIDKDKVILDGKTLLITPPGKEKPEIYYFSFGIPFLTRFNKDEFLNVLNEKIINA